MPFLKGTKPIDRTRTGSMHQDEVVAVLNWSAEQYQAAQACGLQTKMVIRDRPMADDTRDQVSTERRVDIHVLVRWLERMAAIGVTTINGVEIKVLLGGQ